MICIRTGINNDAGGGGCKEDVAILLCKTFEVSASIKN